MDNYIGVNHAMRSGSNVQLFRVLNSIDATAEIIFAPVFG